VDFVEIFNICTRKVIIKAAKRIFHSDKICRSYYDFYFGVTFLEHTVVVQRDNYLPAPHTYTNACMYMYAVSNTELSMMLSSMARQTCSKRCFGSSQLCTSNCNNRSHILKYS